MNPTADLKLPVDVKMEAQQLLKDRVTVPHRGDVVVAIEQIALVFGRNHILMPWLKSLGALEKLPFKLEELITNWGRYRLISNHLGSDPRLWTALKTKLDAYKSKNAPKVYSYYREK